MSFNVYAETETNRTELSCPTLSLIESIYVGLPFCLIHLSIRALSPNPFPARPKHANSLVGDKNVVLVLVVAGSKWYSLLRMVQVQR